MTAGLADLVADLGTRRRPPDVVAPGLGLYPLNQSIAWGEFCGAGC